MRCSAWPDAFTPKNPSLLPVAASQQQSTVKCHRPRR